MKEQEAIRSHLLVYFKRAKKQNPRYSMRSLATKLKVHSGTLSHILNGKRFVSKKLAEKILRTIGLDPQDRAEVLALFPRQRKKTVSIKDTAPEPHHRKLDMNDFAKVYHWEYFTFIHLMRCTDFSEDRQWIAKRMGISAARAEEIIQELIGLKMIRVIENEIKNSDDFRSPDDIPSEVMKKFHDQSLDLAKRSLYRHPIDKRDFTNVTFAVDPAMIPIAKEKIRVFQDELMELISDRNPSQVYRLSMELFPLTDISESAS